MIRRLRDQLGAATIGGLRGSRRRLATSARHRDDVPRLQRYSWFIGKDKRSNNNIFRRKFYARVCTHLFTRQKQKHMFFPWDSLAMSRVFLPVVRRSMRCTWQVKWRWSGRHRWQVRGRWRYKTNTCTLLNYTIDPISIGPFVKTETFNSSITVARYVDSMYMYIDRRNELDRDSFFCASELVFLNSQMLSG